MLKILGAKNCRKNLHKHPGPPFQIRRGPGSFSNDENLAMCGKKTESPKYLRKKIKHLEQKPNT